MIVTLGRTHMSIPSITHVALILCIPSVAVAEVIADSQADFSGTQGLNNWYYGYYDGPFDSSDFTLMPYFTSGAWIVNNETFWTRLFQAGGHPNGITTSGGRTRVEHWAVRRWISPKSGTFRLSGVIADRVADGFGAGAIVRIFLDGIEIYSHNVAVNATSPFNYSFSVTANQGSIIDFAIAPRNSNDNSTGTNFTAVITQEANLQSDPVINCTVSDIQAHLDLSNLLSGREYRIMQSSTLLTWTEAYRFTATDPTSSWSDAFSPDGQRFYRLEWNE